MPPSGKGCLMPEPPQSPEHHRKRFVILRNTPEEYADYPHPECILGGWEALLTEDQRKSMGAKLDEKKKASGATGFHTLDADVQKMVKDKLEENKEWERMFGRLRFATPSFSTRRNKGRWLQNRREQVEQMIATNLYPVHTAIYRT